MKKIFGLALVLFFFFFFAVIVTYPSILNLNNKLIGDGGDNYQYFGFQYIVGQNIKSMIYPFSHTDIFRYPVGFNFGIGYDSVLSALIGGCLSLLISSVPAFNLTILIVLTINGFLSFLFFEFITNDTLMGLFGGVIYGFSAYVLARTAGHINLMFVGGIPFLVYAILGLTKSTLTKKNILFFWISILLIIFGSFQYSILISISLLITLLFVYFLYKERLLNLVNNIWTNKKKFLIIGLPFLLIIFIIIFPFFQALVTRNINTLDRSSSINEFSPTLSDFILPNAFSRLLINNFVSGLENSTKSIEKVVFVGWIELVLFFISLFSNYSKRLKIFLFSLLTIFFVLSLGKFLNISNFIIKMPYSLIYNKFPFNYVPETGRFFIFIYLIIAISIVLFLKNLLHKNKLFIYPFFALCFIFLFVERLPYNFWLSQTFSDEKYINYVKNNTGTAVFDIPADNSFDISTYNILPFDYKKKIISGYFHYLADTRESKKILNNQFISNFICGSLPTKSQLGDNKKLIALLKKNNINTIVVHTNDPEDHAKFYFPECAGARIQTTLLLPQLLMADPTDQQKTVSLFFPAIDYQGDTITLPYDGTFYIDGIQAFPSEWLPLHMSVDGKDVPIKQEWTDHGNSNVTTNPFTAITVKQGSKIRFYFDKNQNSAYSFVKIWYRYKTNNKNYGFMTIDGITKVYEDDNAAVFYIN